MSSLCHTVVVGWGDEWFEPDFSLLCFICFLLTLDSTENVCCLRTLYWSKYMGGFGGGGGSDLCTPRVQIFFLFMQFLKKIGQNNRLALPPLKLAPSTLGNPGSVTSKNTYRECWTHWWADTKHCAQELGHRSSDTRYCSLLNMIYPLLSSTGLKLPYLLPEKKKRIAGQVLLITVVPLCKCEDNSDIYGFCCWFALWTGLTKFYISLTQVKFVRSIRLHMDNYVNMRTIRTFVALVDLQVEQKLHNSFSPG